MQNFSNLVKLVRAFADGHNDITRVSITTQYQRKGLEQPLLDHPNILHLTSHFQELSRRKPRTMDLFQPALPTAKYSVV